MPIIYRGLGNFDYIEWKGPIDFFLWDRVQEAHDAASEITLGMTGEYLPWYRMIEAEWLARDRGQIEVITPWLKLETIPEETGEAEALGARVQAICEDTARSFGVSERPEVLVTVLSAESDAPWLDARAGYFIDKYPYDKICIPQSSVTNPARLQEVVSHEYSHALNLVLSQAKCPLWLNEGIAMLARPQLDPRVHMDLASGAAVWKDPHHLDAAFHAELKGQRDFTTIHRAYDQAAWLVRYLLKLGGRPKLGDLMRAFNDNSLLEELKIRLIAEDRAEEALRQVYGLRESQLFAQAHEWMRRLPIAQPE